MDRSVTQGEKRREDAAQRSRAASQSVRDIARNWPAVSDTRKRNRCLKSFKYFCETCFPVAFNLKWSKDHLRVIKIVERTVVSGGLFAVAMPRGSGKSVICERAALWAIVRGSHQFVIVVGANSDSAEETLAALKMELTENDVLADLFPEVCYPFHCLEGFSNRAKGQTYKGEKTHIEWSSDKIALANVPDKKVNGGVILSIGLKQGFRGKKHGLPSGEQIRPTLVLLDDPQTDESAVSPTQTRKLERTINAGLLGLAGPGKKISALMPCTVIEPDDLADRYLDRERYPDWQGIRTSMLEGWPEDMELWGKYEQIRADSLRQELDIELATKFYRKNRKAMDKGAKATWPERFNRDSEASGIQAAMEYWIRDNDAFWSEYQNKPRRENEGLKLLSADEIQTRQHRLPRSVASLETHKIMCHVDVQQEILFYTVIGFSQQFTAQIIEYGTWPEQSRNHFTLATIRTGISTKYSGNIGARLQKALRELLDERVERSFKCEDHSQRRIDMIGVDVAWRPRDIDRVIREMNMKGHSHIIPVRGFGVTAKDKPMAQRPHKPGDIWGLHWTYPLPKAAGELRRLQVDTNFWKSRVHQQFGTEVGDPTSLSLHEANPNSHAMFADHCTAEYPTELTGPYGTVEQWDLRPGRKENHFFDNVVGSMALASFAGIKSPDLDEGDSGGGPVNRRRVNIRRRVGV